MAEHPLSKREVVGSNPTGGFCFSWLLCERCDFFNSSVIKCKICYAEYIRLCLHIPEAPLRKQMDTPGIEPGASRMLSGCDTTTPCARWLQCRSCLCFILHIPNAVLLARAALGSYNRQAERRACVTKVFLGNLPPLPNRF